MIESILGVCVLASLAAVFYLSHRLASANNGFERLANDAMKHALSINDDSRHYMLEKRRLEAEEYGREAMRRDKLAIASFANGGYPPPPPEERMADVNELVARVQSDPSSNGVYSG